MKAREYFNNLKERQITELRGRETSLPITRVQLDNTQIGIKRQASTSIEEVKQNLDDRASYNFNNQEEIAIICSVIIFINLEVKSIL